MMTVKVFRSVIYLSLVFATLANEVYGKKCKALQEERWSYQGNNGPNNWGNSYPTCGGQEQSPILINSLKVVQDEKLDMLMLNNYDKPITKGTIENNGHTIEVIPDDGISRTISVNGNEYNLRQFQFHWGSDSSKGSEHTFPITEFTMEMHLIHKNNNNQTAVVGVLFADRGYSNEELQKIVDELSNVQYKEDKTKIKSSINLNNILPENPASFYRYQGSLTTPPCTEGVTWSVLESQVDVGTAQMKQFRTQLYSVKKGEAKDHCEIVNNYRPVQDLNCRKVYRSKESP